MLAPRQSRTFIIDGSRFVARTPYPRGFIGHPLIQHHPLEATVTLIRHLPIIHVDTHTAKRFYQSCSRILAHRQSGLTLVPIAWLPPHAFWGPVLPSNLGQPIPSLIGSNVDLTHHFPRSAPGNEITENNSRTFDAPTLSHQLPLRNSPLFMIRGKGGSPWDDNGYRVLSSAGFHEKSSRVC